MSLERALRELRNAGRAFTGAVEESLTRPSHGHLTAAKLAIDRAWDAYLDEAPTNPGVVLELGPENWIRELAGVTPRKEAEDDS